ncbi:hypothetical protein AB0E96_37535, partial [Kitasatospora sp. NPDC036755]|uniref:hypothetical protein n=1 Tax=Kitasatospora sp. NPDC036755 TaxID=3154600 RepID=UPI00340567EF
RRNAIEVQELEGPALDDAVGVALAAKDILAERAQAAVTETTAVVAEPPAPAVEQAAPEAALVIERAAPAAPGPYYGGGLHQ